MMVCVSRCVFFSPALVTGGDRAMRGERAVFD